MNDSQKTSVEKALIELENSLTMLEQAAEQKARQVRLLKKSANDSIQKIDQVIANLKGKAEE